jgi:SAM-dependent methyltransferase
MPYAPDFRLWTLSPGSERDMDIRLPDMPFYWRTRASEATLPNDPPSRMAFEFDYLDEYGLLIERRSDILRKTLEDVYRREANVGFLQEENVLAKGYGEDFWKFLESVFASNSVNRVLEIGCGGCWLLDRVRKTGREVLGVDPSPIAGVAGRKLGIEILEEFFPPRRMAMVPDLIVHVDVLEHIEDPVAFLRGQHDALPREGLLVVNVPDSTRCIALGDVSMALHQHVNMFNDRSLSTTLHAAGFAPIRIERSGFGGSLYCLARKQEPLSSVTTSPPSSRTEYDSFTRLAELNISAFRKRVEDARLAGTVGFFMPQRAFPYLAAIGWLDGFRIFDNMNVWHGHYLDGCNTKVENESDLIADPVDHVFIMSLTFGEQVKKSITAKAPLIRSTTLAEIISANNRVTSQRES